MLLLPYFGLREDPFGATPDPRGIYESSTHCEALASLKYGFLSSRGFIALIAPPGLGKTTLLLRFLEEIRISARTVFLFDVDPKCEPRDVISYILRDLGVTPGKDSAEMHQQLSDVIAAEAMAGRSFVVVIDEAQNLSDTSLEVIRMLTNFETSRSKLVQVVLSGQPQLADRLSRPSLEQLRQRIAVFSSIKPLSAEQSRGYIDHRLKFCGYSGDPLFNSEALALLIDAGQGVPRIINTLCFSALSLCCALKCKQVNADMVTEVIADRQLAPPVKIAESRELLADGAATQNSLGYPPPPTRRVLSRPLVIALSTGLPLLLIAVFAMFVHRTQPRQDGLAQAGQGGHGSAATQSSVLGPPRIGSAPVSVAITVKRNESLRELALRHLGSFDETRIRQIRSLNPGLTDLDLILEGQTILLPAH